MERHAFAMKVKEGKMNDYRKTLGEIWPELTAYLDRNGIHNFSIWNAADLIFGYYENADGAVISPESKSSTDRKNPGYIYLDLHPWKRHASDVS